MRSLPTAFFNQLNPEKICLDGFDDLLLHLRKLLSKLLDQYPSEAIPDYLLIPLNEIKMLCNSTISGLRLPDLMVRDTLRKINSALADHLIFNTGKG